MKVQLYEGLLVVVIIVVIVVLILAVRSDKKNIEKTFDNTLTYLKSHGHRVEPERLDVRD